MTIFGDLIHATRNHLMTGQQDRLNVLDVSVDNNPSTMTIQFRYEPKAVAEGTQISVGLEDLHVLSISGNTPGSQATCIRGVNGSSVLAHTAGDLIRVAPQFTDFKLGHYVNECLDDLSAEGLFRIRSVEFTYNPAVSGYNLPNTDLIDIWRVRYKSPGVDNYWDVIPPADYYLDQDANTDPDQFPSGTQLVLRQGGYSGQPVRVSYRASFPNLTAVTDDVLAVAGLHTQAHKLPPLGAAIDALGGREIKRSFLNRQPEPRRQQEVPPGSANQSMLPLIKLYESKLAYEVKRLKRRYPGAH